ncbi:MAG: fimbrial biogenesis outer membrane usher protein [Leptolyngbya sp. SIO4C5]|nr:fimbrial biogenesis outer membrane usher protein [Leptolyngbya sp. SIO4C5]
MAIDSPSLNPIATSDERHAEAIDNSSADGRLPSSPPETSENGETEQLFEAVFGRSRDSERQQVVVPLFINGYQQGQAYLQIIDSHQLNIFIDAADLLEVTKEQVKLEVQSQLSALSTTGQINLRDVRHIGLEISFDQRRLELHIDVPAALRATSVSDVGNTDVPSGYDTAIQPSSSSAYLNVRGGQAMVWTGNRDEIGRQPLLLSFDGALNINGWVLEGQMSFVENRTSTWQRGNFSLVRDDVSQAIRYRIGDLSVPVRGYQSSVPSGGITIARNFSLQPYRVTRPISRYEFFLERAATVQAFVNGQLVQTLRLEAGPQDVRNLPLNAGVNEVNLVITDDVGQVQTLEFTTGVASELLAPGVEQFAYSLGLPSENRGFTRQYNLDEVLLTLSHRAGITEQLTLGGYFQGNLERQLIGFEGTWATSIGNWTWDAAVSRDPHFGTDFAVRLFYDLLQPASSDTQRTLRFGLEYRGDNFMTLAEEQSTTPNKLDFSISYGQRIFEDVQATFNGRYQMARDGDSDAYELALSIAKPLRQGLNLTLNGNYGVNASGETIQRLNFGTSRCAA